jgi:hypothetical protein
MKKLLILLFLSLFVYLAGCISLPGDPSDTPSNQTISEKNLHTVNCRVFDVNNMPMGYASITITYNSSEYSDGFIYGSNLSVMIVKTDENGNFSLPLNKLVPYNFTVARQHDEFSTLLIPTDDLCLIKPTSQVTSPPVPVNTLTMRSPTTLQELIKGINKGVGWFNGLFQ